jgi:2-polyprenyl-6-methoxyphenol hydroxylase-like FAD-dependent oxidoreductase
MPRIIVMGAGAVGLTTAMLLAKDGHEVVVLERDPDPPVPPAAAWASWQRRGVNQFRLPHFLLGRYRQIVDAELPEVARALEEAGGLRTNVMLAVPEELRGPEQPSDGDFEVITARRPVFESALAGVAETTADLDVRRGVSVEGLLFADDGRGSPRHVVGVATDGGEELRGDLVVDLMGRRSSLPRLLEPTGRAPIEELDDSGFMYIGRHYQSADGSVPFAFGPALMHYGTISSLTLAADNGTWGVVAVISAKDRPLLGLRDPDRWERLVRSLPLVAHWLDGAPIEEGMITISKIEDRIRTFVVDGEPVATGVVAVGDAWACSNPTMGRGISIGSMHGLALRDTIRKVGLDDGDAFAAAFAEATDEAVGPWFQWTRRGDRHRLAEIDALAAGGQYEPPDPEWELERELGAAAQKDPELLRAFVRAQFVLEPLDRSLADPAVRARVHELGGDWREQEVLAPDRAQLLALASS